MNLIDTFNSVISVFKNRTSFEKFTNITILIWLISIPAKNSIYHICTALIVMLSIYSLCTQSDSIKSSLKIFYRKYIDIIFALAMIIVSMAISNCFSDLTTIENWLSLGKFLYRYIFILFSLLYLYEKHCFSTFDLNTYVFIALSICSIAGIYEASMNFGSETSISGFVYNRNPFGMTMLAGVVSATLSIRHCSSHSNKPIRYNGILIFLLFIFILSVVFSQSRSSWLATALFFFFMGVTNISWVTKHKILLFLIVISIIALVIFDKPLLERFVSIFNFSDPHRMAIWNNAIEHIKEKPFLGFGLIEYKLIGLKKYAGTHNSILEILLFTGTLGLISFLMVFLVTIKEIIYRKQFEMLFGFFSLLVPSLFNLSILGNKIYLSILTVFLFFVFSKRKESIAGFKNE